MKSINTDNQCISAYKKSLEDAITSDTSGLFCRILVSLVQVCVDTFSTPDNRWKYTLNRAQILEVIKYESLIELISH